MLVVAMAFAACWGVVQLAALGSPARSVRAATLLLAVGTGMYACGVAAVAIQYAYTRAVAAVTGDPLTLVVSRAGYTVDPFVEEVVKVLPLLLVAWLVRTRRQWGVTDHLVLGSALGAGFGLLEALMRFGHRTGNAIRVPEGWLLPVGLSPPVIPDPGTVLTSWFPAPVGSESFISEGTTTGLHLAWSALAGFGVGLLVRGRGPVRLAGPLLLLLVGTDHAAFNYDLAHGGRGGALFGDVVTAPFVAAQPLLWLWPLVALVAAVVLDVRTRRRVRAAGVAALRLRREGDDTAANTLALARYAVQGLPWTLLVVPRFVAVRRAAHYACQRGVTPAARQLLDDVAEIRDRMDAADSPAAWRGAGRLALGAGPGDRTPRRLLARSWPLLVWALLLVPVLAYYLIGTTPFAGGVQDALERRGLFHLILVLPAAVGLVLLTWQVVAGARTLPAVLRLPYAEPAARAQFRLVTALGAGGLGVVVLGSWLRGARPGARVLSNVHVLDALSSLLLAAGIVLVVGAFVFFPPSIGLVAVATAGGATVLVPTVAASGAFTTTAALGVGGIVLSQAAAAGANRAGGGRSGSGGGSSGVPDMPQKPPARWPQVRHWKLRNIVGNIFKGTRNPDRIGDGTTMDAVRNELRTGRPTEGFFHLEKARTEIRALNRWLERYGPTASREDRLWAWRLRAELQKALRGL
jgi:hypothetical protein